MHRDPKRCQVDSNESFSSVPDVSLNSRFGAKSKNQIVPISEVESKDGEDSKHQVN